MSKVLDSFRQHEALLEGHFQLSSGLHSSRYLQCAKVLAHPRVAEELCRELAAKWKHPAPDVVIGPAMGGITLAYELGRAFGVTALFAERENGAFTLRRGFQIAPGARVLIAEDVVTTGGSVIEVLQLVERLGAVPCGVMSLIQRTDKNPFNVPYVALEQVIPPVWKPEECPLCLAGGTAIKPGSRPGGVAARP
ncbi:MAG: orotate phosphoribosyltransferase [Planctomycetes bacterium]|nr:orotate phosphoribosyltransferase [Planctomycetota bacterium]